MATISKTFLDTVQPPVEGYRIYWDETPRGYGGYGLRVNSKGTKSFVVQGRLRGTSVLFTIGSYPRFTEAEARKVAREILQGFSKGIDPREVRRKPKDVPTLRQLADEYVNRPSKDMKQSSKDAIDRHVRTTFKTKEHRPITEITESYCVQRYDAILRGGINGDRKGGAPGQANQAHAILKALLNYAIRRKKGITSNSCDAVTKDDRKALKPRTSYIKPNRIGHVWNWLTEQRSQAYTQGAMGRLDLARFLLWTGARLTEALTLEWKNVSIDEGWWHLPDPKNRTPLHLPLCTQAIEMLKVRRKEVPANVSWVFPSARSKAGHMEDPRDTLWKSISEIAKEPISAHDLRRSFTNYGLRECDLDYYRIELLTGHKPTSVTLTHYTDTQDLRRWSREVQTIADWIDKQGLIAAAGNVVQLPLRKTA